MKELVTRGIVLIIKEYEGDLTVWNKGLNCIQENRGDILDRLDLLKERDKLVKTLPSTNWERERGRGGGGSSCPNLRN